MPLASPGLPPAPSRPMPDAAPTSQADPRDSKPGASPFERVSLMGVSFWRMTERQLVDFVIAESGAGRGGWIITPNLDILRLGVQQAEIRALLGRADVLVADGMPLIWASKLKGTPLPERVSGSHIMWSIPEAAAKAGRSIYLLGGAPGASDACAHVLREKYPGARITGTYCPPFGFEKSPEEMAKMRAAIQACPADLIFVALSFPKGERLIEAIRDAAPRAWWIGVGISFSFVAGEVKKAPRWMQRAGLEWSHRLIQEPRRLAKRYLVHGIPFALRLLVTSALRRG